MPFGVVEKNLVEELPHWDIVDAVVFAEDGSCEIGLEIKLPASTLYPQARIDGLHLTLMSVLRNKVPVDERLRLLVEAAPLSQRALARYRHAVSGDDAAAHAFANLKARMLEAKRREENLLEYRAYVTCTLSGGRRKKPPWSSTAACDAYSPAELEALLARADQLRRTLYGALQSAGFDPDPLRTQGAFELGYRYFNPSRRFMDAPRYKPPERFFTDRVLKRAPELSEPTLRYQLVDGDLEREWDTLGFSSHVAKVVTMGSLPKGETETEMLSQLLFVPSLYWLVIDYVHEPQGHATRGLLGRSNRLSSASSAGGFTTMSDPGTAENSAQLEAGLRQIERVGSHVFKAGVAIVLLYPTLEGVREAAQDAMNKFTALPGVKVIDEHVGLWTRFVELSPFSGKTNRHVFKTLEENATAFFPLNAPWNGSDRPRAVFENRWNGLTAVDPFDPRNPNYNGLVVGGSGMGKSFFVQCLLGQLLNGDVEVMVMDMKEDYRPLMTLRGGQVIPLRPGGGVSLNPFDLPDGETELDDQQQAFLLGLLRTMIPATDPAKKAEENALLRAAIQQTYTRHTTQRRGVNGEVTRVFTGARLSDLKRVLETLEEVGDAPADTDTKALGRKLALQLQNWVGDTPYGKFLDRPTTVNLTSRLVYFEASGIKDFEDFKPVAMLLVADLMWRRFKANRGRPKLAVIEEAGVTLKIPEAAAIIEEVGRLARTYNAGLWLVSQFLEDFTHSSAARVLNNLTLHFLLPVPGEEGLVQQTLGLSDRAMEAFRSLGGKRGEYRELLAWLRQEDRIVGDILVNRPDPLELWAYTSHAPEVAVRDAAMAEAADPLEAVQKLAETRPQGLAA